MNISQNKDTYNVSFSSIKHSTVKIDFVMQVYFSRRPMAGLAKEISEWFLSRQLCHSFLILAWFCYYHSPSTYFLRNSKLT